MKNKVWKHNNSLIIKFQYHPRLLNVIREVEGRIFNKANKRWEVPVTSVIQCVDILKEAGFSISDDVWQAYDEAKAFREEVKKIKESPKAEYDGDLPLFNFQKVGAAFIKKMPHCLLGDEMGTGKSIQTMAAYEDISGPILVLVPASLKFSWLDELAKWVPQEKCHVIHGVKQARDKQWETILRAPAKWSIANYELLLRDFDLIKAIPWQAIVCDEARITNPFAKTTKVLKEIKAPRKLALTGTPLNNNPVDIWSITDWLQPRMLGTFKQFREKYCVVDKKWNSIIGYRNLDDLRDRLEFVMLRRTKDEVLDDFPKKTVQEIRFDITKDERVVYDGVRKQIREELDKMDLVDPRTLNILPVKMLRLLQVADSPELITGNFGASSKINTLKELLDNILA